jgi:site-specific DNA-cytosine methylase
LVKSIKDGVLPETKKQPLQTKMIDLLEKIVDNSLTITNRDIIVYSKKEYNNPKQLNLYGEMKNVSGKISTHRSSKIIVNPIISPCLTTKGHTTIFHKNIVRNLSPTEQKRLHGFSENYKLPIDNYKLSSHIMGNTLSPVVMKELIKGVLFMDEYNTKSNNTDYLPTTKKLVA